MGYDFNQLLKRYVYIMSIKNYDPTSNDVIFFKKCEYALNLVVGMELFEFITLPDEVKGNTYEVYVGFNQIEHGFDDSFVYNLAIDIVAKLGMQKENGT